MKPLVWERIKSVPQTLRLLCLELARCCVCSELWLLLLGAQAVLHSALMITAPLFPQAAVVMGLVLWSPGLPALQSHRALQLSDSS